MTKCEQRSISIRTGRHVVTTNLNIRQIREMHSLREQVYVRELGWIASSGRKIGEMDEFDGSSTHFCVLDSDSHVIATVRLTLSNQRWMLDSYFRHLLPSFPSDRYFSNVSEISRLAVSPRYRNVVLDQRITAAELLYQTLFRYSMLNELRYSYAVVSAQVFRHLLRCGVSCAAVSPPRVMPDGVVALVIKIDWQLFKVSSVDCGDTLQQSRQGLWSTQRSVAASQLG